MRGEQRRSLRDLTDRELDQYVMTRLTLAGVDLSVLPERDETAPVDRARILRSARDFLRGDLQAITDYPLDSVDGPPALYPAALTSILGDPDRVRLPR